MRFTDRFYKIMFVLGCLIVLSLGFAKQDGFEKMELAVYRVQYGDTLWSIAKTYGGESVKVQEYIDRVQELNGIGSMIYVGQEIQIYR